MYQSEHMASTRRLNYKTNVRSNTPLRLALVEKAAHLGLSEGGQWDRDTEDKAASHLQTGT